MSVPLFDPDEEVEVTRRNLPHWKQDGKTYFVTFRVADSLPEQQRRQLVEDRVNWKERYGSIAVDQLTAPERAEYYRLFHQRVEQWLDAGYGSCPFKRFELRTLVQNALSYFDGQRYQLDEFTVAANHVHCLVTPYSGHDISAILHSWKSFTANKINRVLQKTGQFWLDENFDHLVRSEAQFEKYQTYIRGHAV